MNFGSKWCKWISPCLSSASVSVLINGSLSKEFKIERGLRQGDPLSSFMFLIAAKALQVMTIEACNKGIFKGLSLDDDGSNISLLQFANEALFFDERSKSNVRHLIQILDCFHDVSSLKINLDKSRLFGIGVSPEEVSSIARSVNCSNGSCLLSTLGCRLEESSFMVLMVALIRPHLKWVLEDGFWHTKWAWRRHPSGRACGELDLLKGEAEPAPPAHDPRDVETIEKLQHRIQELELRQLRPDSPTEEAETEPNVWDDGSVDVNPFGGEKPRYVNHLYQPRRNDLAVDRDDRYRDDPIRSLRLKIEIPEFIGKVHPNDFIDWLSTVERVFDVRDIPDKLKVKLVAIKLRQHASLWCDVAKEEEQVVARFLGVLKPEIDDIVSLQPYWTYTNVCRLALKFKKQVKAKSRGFTSRFTPPTKTAPPTTPKATTPITSAAGPIYNTEAELDLDEPGDELVYPDREEALVIQRVLNVAVLKSVEDNSWLRNNIFRTKCTSKGKIYDMIIDGGSCENVVSTYMVEKLGMKTEDHPESYQLTWLKKGTLLRSVNVVLCSFLLVNPKSRWIILTGYPSGIGADTGLEIINGYGFTKTRPKPDPFPSLVIHDDIPHGLPTIRDIQHCIDFIPGFVIPNRPAYWMNPKEFAELQRQVTELLEKGLIRASMSPCAVHAFYMVLPFFKIDLRSGYHHIQLRLGDEWKTAFKTRDGLYDWRVMPFGLSNASSTFMRLMNQGDRFTWTSKAAKAFDILKAKVTEAPVLALPNFDEVFQVECDASGVGIGGVLSQNQRPIAFFSEKLNDARRKYSTYDKEFYAIVRSLDTWRHYLLSNEFVLFSYHEALKFINGQHKLKSRHAKSVEFIQAFSFVIRHKFSKLDGYLFKGVRLCIPLCSLCEAIILEGHAGGLAGHFGRDKTLALLREQFYWPKMELDVNRLLERSFNHTTCKSPLEVVYGRNPITPLDLVHVPKVGWFSEEWADQSEHIKELHRSVQEQIIQHNKQYKERANKRRKQVLYQEGNLVWIHLRKERFPGGRFGKLKPRGDGPFHLSPYKGDSDDERDSGSSLFQEGEDDADTVNVTNTLGAYFAAKNFCDGLG
nr:hypothetical protein [Tanacetum cinerariifolium]